MLPKGYLKSLFVAHGVLNDFQVLPVLVLLAIPVMLTTLIRWLVLLVGKAGQVIQYFYFAPPWAKRAQRLSSPLRQMPFSAIFLERLLFE